MRRALRTACLLGLSIGMPSHTLAAVDAVEAARQLAGTYQNADALTGRLRWDLVVGPPYLLLAPGPSLPTDSGWRGTLLATGQEIIIHVPAHALLRVVADDTTGAPPSFFISDGNGAAAPLTPLLSVDGGGWLLKSPLAHAALIHVRGATAARRLGFFLGRFEPPPQALLYRQALSLPGEKVPVRQVDEAVARAHTRMRAGQEVNVTVTGPARLALDYELDAGPDAVGTRIAIDVSLKLGTSATAQQLTGPESVAPRTVDGVWHPGVRSEHLAITIPAGTHVLRLKSSHSILSRATVLEAREFLLPALNLTPTWQDLAPADALAQREQQSIAAAAGNAWRDGGLLAAQSLDRVARAHPIVPALRQTADELERQFGAYRDLPPFSIPEEAAAGTHAYFFRTAQLPSEPPRHDIQHAETLSSPLPTAEFYSIGRTPIRYSFAALAHPRRLRLLVSYPAGLPGKVELRYDNGAVAMIDIGATALDEARLRPVGASVVAALDATAALPSPLPVMQVATVEWQVPAGARSVSMRLAGLPGQGQSSAAIVLLALQELRSANYVLDDRFMAQLAAGVDIASPGALLLQDALKPFQRRLAQARQQFVANVAPIDTQSAPASAAQPLLTGKVSQQIEAEAVTTATADPVRAFESWRRLANAADPEIRVRALRGQALALLASGERYAAERLLRGHWIGADTRLAQTAAEELHALYKREADLPMLTQLAAARAATDSSAFADLAQAFVAEGEDQLALQAGLLAVPRDLPLLLQSALRSRQWITFDTLSGQLGKPQERAFWRMQRALAAGRPDVARTLASAADSPEWIQALEQAAHIVPRLAADANPQERPAAVNDWLNWQQRHPGPRAFLHEPGIVRQHGGGAVLRNVGLDLTSTWWRAVEDRPLRVRLVGPARVRVEARPLHADSAGLASGWLRMRAPGQHWLQPFRQNQVAPGLLLDGEGLFPGTTVKRDVLVPAGIHDIEIDAGIVPIIARVMVERPALAAAGLPAPTAPYFEHRQRLLASLESDPHCGGVHGCQITIDASADRLHARRVRIDGVPWPGLPAPSRAENKAAARLAVGDILGAFESSEDPGEKMGLLSWLAETRPAERATALAYGAALAARHPTADLIALWQHMEAQSAWNPLPIVDRSAGLRAIEVAPGTPEAPAGRIRAAMLEPLRAGEILLGADSRATLWLNRTAAATLAVELRAENLPGMPFLAFSAVVERNGRVVQRLQFDGAAGMRTVRVPLPAGEQQIAVRLEAPYANQFARVRFAGLPEAAPTVTRDWHIATPGQPVQVTVAGPTWLRVDRHTPTGIRSEQRLFITPTSRMMLPAEPGARETLYRVFLRRADPEPAAPKPPRPNAYQPQPMPEPPAQWLQTETEAATKVRFIDPYPLGELADATWSGRLGVIRRQDAETTGGDTERKVERYTEAGLGWRQRSADGLEFRHADAFVRRHVVGSPSLGVSLALNRSVPWTVAWPYPFDLSAALGLVAQNTPDGMGVALTAGLAVAQERLLSEKLSHRPSVEINARALSLNRVSDPDQADNDVFSRYRKQHPWALTVSDTVSWRPWRDSHASARAAFVSNPDLNLFRPDHFSLDAQWRQLAGAMMVEAGVRVIRFLADKDRADGITRRDLRVGASWEHWLKDGSRAELRAEARRNLSSDVNWGGSELRWHWGSGRGLRDFSAHEIDFRSIRSWRVPAGSTLIEEP